MLVGRGVGLGGMISMSLPVPSVQDFEESDQGCDIGVLKGEGN